MRDRGFFGAAIAGAIVLGFLAFAIFAGIHPLPQANRDILNTIVGILNSALMYVVGYYFGSSRTAEQRQPERPPVTVPPPLEKKP